MHPIPANNSFTAPLSNREAINLAKLRSTYNYPKSYILQVPASTRLPSDIRITPHLYGRFVQGGSTVTDIWLDNYHYDLLRSGVHDLCLLGTASIIYWGFYTFGHNYAKTRVDRHINGYKSLPATSPSALASLIKSSIADVSSNDMATALSRFNSVSQLSRTPFASKIIAFMAPSVAGIYDNKINKVLEELPWTAGIKNGIGSTINSTVMSSYQNWCLYLMQMARQLNLGISHGSSWHWTCGADEKQMWRAIDVERAFFAGAATFPHNANLEKS